MPVSRPTSLSKCRESLPSALCRGHRNRSGLADAMKPHYSWIMVTCAECHGPVPDDSASPAEERTPCPACGSTGRSHSVHVTDLAGATDMVVDVDLTLGPGPRPWTETWALFEHSFDELQAFFTTPDRAAEQWKMLRVTNDFMAQCYAVKEHIKRDPSVPVHVRRQVENYARASDGIRLAIDVHNTVKHRDRRAGERYARVGQTSTGPRATIHWTAADRTEGKEDVLSVARRANQEWRSFIEQNKLSGST